MGTLTDTGYVIKNQNQWFADEQALYLAIDPLWNIDPSTPDGLKIASDAEIFANLDEIGQRAYNSKDPDKAKGTDLNVVSFITGTIRNPGTSSNVELTLGGVPGTVIIQGKIVESVADGSQWSTDAAVTIGGGGTVTVDATALIAGATQASIATITRIVSTVGGWQTVTNLTVALAGEEQENDPQLRLRRTLSVGKPGNNQIDSMLGELLDQNATPNVRRAVTPENYTGSVDGDGLPAHSIAPIVDGGTDDDVALSIFRKKNPGCDLYAAGTPVKVFDVFDKFESNTADITFSRPIYVPMIVAVTIANDGSLPNNADQLIKDAIISYSAGMLVDPECGFNTLGFDIGEEVPISRMYTPVNSVIGSYGNSYVTGLTVNGSGSGQITIAFNELSQWTDGNITVVINP